MTSLEPLLVPYDASSHAQAAALLARLLAARTGATTWLVHALPDDGALGDRITRAAQADELLSEEARRFTTPVQVRLVDGVPAAALAAEAERAGLVILGSRGRSVVTGLMLGSVARYLLHSVSRPVLAVHGPLPEVRRILVGVDESAASVATVRVARALADATGAALTLAHVVKADPDAGASAAALGVSDADWAGALAAHAERVFAPLRPIAGPADERLEFGNPAERLRALARAEQADVVAVGRKGASGRDVDAWFSVAFALAVKGPHATLVV
jgi:nucleotide-binding universal stress UspA family protein